MSDIQDPFARLAAPPVFVVGHHRSGTTWIYDILAHRDDVAGVFESWMFTTEQGFGGALHWGQWEPVAIDAAHGVAERPAGLAQLVDRTEARRAIGSLVRSWFGRVIEPHHRYFVEKSPDHLYAVAAISEVFADARFINVIRDGRDVAVSVLAARTWSGRTADRRTHLVDAARRWRNALEVSAKAAAYLGPRYLEVTYEDLLADPHRVIGQMYAFAGLPTDPGTIDAAVEATRFESMRRGPDDAFRRSGRAGDWRRELSRADRRLVHRIAGRALIERGYANSSSWWWRGSN